MYLHWKSSSLVWFFIYSQCYSVLLPLYFHGPLNFALLKCYANLILRVFKKDTLYKYQVGAVLRPISMLIFKKKVQMEPLMMYTCYFDSLSFYKLTAHLSVRHELAYLTLIRSDASLVSILYVFLE